MAAGRVVRCSGKDVAASQVVVIIGGLWVRFAGGAAGDEELHFCGAWKDWSRRCGEAASRAIGAAGGRGGGEQGCLKGGRGAGCKVEEGHVAMAAPIAHSHSLQVAH